MTAAPPHPWLWLAASAVLALSACAPQQPLQPSNTPPPSTSVGVKAPPSPPRTASEHVQRLSHNPGLRLPAPLQAEAEDTLASPRPSDQQGIASWYGPKFHGKPTASGERFDRHDFTAAHPNYAFGTRLCVHSPKSGKSVIVRVNDRGPFAKQRILDVSQAAARALDMLQTGVRRVEVWKLDEDEAQCPTLVATDQATSQQTP